MSASSSVRRGVLLMVAATAMLAVADAVAKALTQFYSVPWLAAARYLIGLFLLFAWLAASGGLAHMRTGKLPIQALRGFLIGLTPLFFLSALRVMSLADTYAITLTYPLLVALLGVPMLGERLDARKLVAGLAGFVGVLVILRPASSAFSAYMLLPLGASLLGALYMILTRKLASSDPPLTSLFYMLLLGTLVNLPSALVWGGLPSVEASDWILLILMGIFALGGNLAMIRSFYGAPAALLAPLNYLLLVWAVLFGALAFGDLPDLWSVLGMMIIVGSGWFVARAR